MTRRLRVDIHVELICPWCQIGMRHFDRARSLLQGEQADLALDVHWQLQPLLPDLPPEGLPFVQFYLQRLGGTTAVAARQAQVRAAGREVGLEFAFERIERMPHTGLAHALLEDARGQLSSAAFEALLERLFAAHFQFGEHLGDPQLLLSLAEDFGVTVGAAPPPPARPDPRVQGVPRFAAGRGHVISGAAPADQLLAFLRLAAAAA